MLVKNVDEKGCLVNGSVGRIVGFWKVGICVASAGPQPHGANPSGSVGSDDKGKGKEQADQEEPDKKPHSVIKEPGAKLGGFIRHVRVGAEDGEVGAVAS